MIKLPEKVKVILEILKTNGFEGYVVGGCVRDSILGLNPNDWDITTNANPQQIQEIFKDYKIVYNNGLKHGTVPVMIDNEIFEITTYRVDSEYFDHRHPLSVTYTKSLKEDLKRRDFTINAMAYDGNKVIDFFGGISDLKNKTIKCVGDATSRFNEDALRILRALRFSSKLGFIIESKTEQAMFSSKELLSCISHERIREEFNGILLGRNARNVLDKYRQIISYFIPEIEACFDFKQNNPYHKHDVFNHILDVVDKTPLDLITRLSAFFHDIGKPETYSEEVIGNEIRGHFYGHCNISANMVQNIMTRLCYPSKMIDDVCFIVKNHELTITPTEKSIKKLLNKNPNIDTIKHLIDLKNADRLSHLFDNKTIDFEEIKSIIDAIVKKQECFSLKNLKINGYDLIDLGLKGKEIGDMLDALLNEVLEEKIENEKSSLINRVKSIIDSK